MQGAFVKHNHLYIQITKTENIVKYTYLLLVFEHYIFVQLVTFIV